MTFRTLAHGVFRCNSDPMRSHSHGRIVPLAYRPDKPARRWAAWRWWR